MIRRPHHHGDAFEGVHARACGLLSHDAIGAALGISGREVERVEADGLIKMRIGLMLVELVGRTRADVVLARLRGRPLREWHRELSHAQTRTSRRYP